MHLEFERRLTYLMLFRLILISLVLGSTLALYGLSDLELDSPNSIALFILIGITYVLTIAYALAVRARVDLVRLSVIQLAGDLFISAALVHVTGGAQSAYTFFFPLSVVAAAILHFRRGAVLMTLATIVVLVTVDLIGWYELLPIPAGQRISASEITGIELARSILLNATALVAISALSTYLGGQLFRTREALASERSVSADLRTLHADIVRSLPSGLVTFDRDGYVLSVNDAAEAILEAPGELLTGATLAAILPTLPPVSAHPDPNERHELTLGNKTLGYTVSPLFHRKSASQGYVLNFQDLTELRRMEDNVRRAERLAVVGRFAAGIAHEIRNPLAAISGSVELLKSAPQVDEDSEALMAIVIREIDRLNRLITDLLTYTAPRKLARVPVDLSALVRETIRVCTQDPKFSDLRIESDLPAAKVLVSADPERLRQVVWNLLRNAAEASTSLDAPILVRVAADEAHVTLAVSDDGAGIAKERRDRVFDPFFTTKSHGTGLGLATVHAIVSDHEGTIDFDTEVEQGTTFTVRLPTDL